MTEPVREALTEALGALEMLVHNIDPYLGHSDAERFSAMNYGEEIIKKGRAALAALPVPRPDIQDHLAGASKVDRCAQPLLMIATGEYSDYSPSGPYKVLRPFTFAEAVEAYKAQWVMPEYGYPDRPGPDGFPRWLESAGYIEALDAVEVHVGSYGDIELSEESLALRMVPAENAADHHEAPRSNEKEGSAVQRQDGSTEIREALEAGKRAARDGPNLTADERSAIWVQIESALGTLGEVAGALPAIPAERSTAFLDWWHDTGRKLPEGADMIERAFEAGRAAPVETAAPKPSLDHLAQEPRGGSKTPGGRA